MHETREACQREVSARTGLQWDPDRAPGGAAIERRTIQLGLRGKVLAGFRGEAIESIEDITDFVESSARIGTIESGWRFRSRTRIRLTMPTCGCGSGSG